uniref:Insulin-like 3 n=1 Tax=Oryzias melastigma TaxID=30732 RepID=A0A3B3DRG1_ORYME
FWINIPAILLFMIMLKMCAVHAQERIKMCGRDLIRLAVSYCGNPRNRRSLPDAELDQHEALCKLDCFSKVCQDREPEPDRLVEQQTPEVLHLRSDEEKPPPSVVPRWFSRSFRIRRAAKKVSDICCEEGCSMKELIQFC